MTERGIIFSAPMVRALLGGTKTQTRRLATSPLRRCVPGDRLWVRETWAPYDAQAVAAKDRSKCFYRADDEARHDDDGRWTPSIHMPRWASRITLEVTAVRTEQLQRITEADCLAEGPEVVGDQRSLGGAIDGGVMVRTDRDCVYATPRAWYRELWDKLHGAGTWDANPEVVVLTFQRTP